MENGFSKKDFQRMYNVNRTIFSNWLAEIKNDFVLKKTRQTFTPKQIQLIICELGFPPYANEKERVYIDKILYSK